MARVVGVLVVSLAACLPAGAGQVDAHFVASVRVPERTTVTPLEPVERFVVSEADVARGHADLTARYLVSSNSPRGFLLTLAPRLGLAQRVEVRGLGGDVVLQDQPVEVYSRGTERRRELVLELRVVLADDVPAGLYPLPVVLDASPL